MNDKQPNQHPERGEDPIRQPPTHQVAQHDIHMPRWPHRDPGLTPTPEHQPTPAGQPIQTPRLIAPPSLDSGTWVAHHRQGKADPGSRLTERRAGTAGLLGRRYMTAVIARLGEPLRHPTVDPEPEAGA